MSQVLAEGAGGVGFDKFERGRRGTIIHHLFVSILITQHESDQIQPYRI